MPVLRQNPSGGPEIDLSAGRRGRQDDLALTVRVLSVNACQPAPNPDQTPFATLDLEESAVDGPPGLRVTLTLDVSFKPHAAGRSYVVEVLATDEVGHEQGFEPKGQLTVLEP
jgi:hypothetical protein